MLQMHHHVRCHESIQTAAQKCDLQLKAASYTHVLMVGEAGLEGNWFCICQTLRSFCNCQQRQQFLQPAFSLLPPQGHPWYQPFAVLNICAQRSASRGAHRKPGPGAAGGGAAGGGDLKQEGTAVLPRVGCCADGGRDPALSSRGTAIAEEGLLRECLLPEAIVAFCD